jgi:pimeloyl-ACP methyl ester carboxylesterase
MVDGPMSKVSSLFSMLLGLTVLGPIGCAATRQEVHRPPSTTPSRGVVFVADGAGGFHAPSDAFQNALREEGIPLHVESAAWSHGYLRVLADEMDYCYARQEGQRLAVQVAAYRQHCPTGEIYLVGHSAGSAVVLAAAEALAPDSVDRIILLSPSVSTNYDVKPALRACRGGMDVYYSERDTGFLGLGVALVGTADRLGGPAAGRVGFRLRADTDADMRLYTRLRQHPWNPAVAWTGNGGGHYGSHQVSFLRAYVLPLLTPAGG